MLQLHRLTVGYLLAHLQALFILVVVVLSNLFLIIYLDLLFKIVDVVFEVLENFLIHVVFATTFLNDFV